MVAQTEKIPMSVEEYLELDRSSSDTRYEYADGYAYLMSGGTPQHALIIGNFQGELSRQLEARGSSCLAYPADATVWLSEEMVYRQQSTSQQWLIQFYAPGEDVELVSLNINVAVNTIYRRVAFPENPGRNKWGTL